MIDPGTATCQCAARSRSVGSGFDIDAALGNREYGLTPPGSTDPVRVTTDPDHYREHADSVELWSPGNVLFQPPERASSEGGARPPPDWSPGTTLKDILDDPT